MFTIAETTPAAQPTGWSINRDLLDRDGTFRAIEAPLLAYQLRFGPMDIACYQEWATLAAAGPQSVTVPREDTFLPFRYDNAHVRVARKSWDNGAVSGLEIEIIVYQAAL